MRTLRDLQQEFPISPENGLTLEAAGRSRDKYGYNKLTPLPREPIWKKFLEKFDEPIIKILLAAALLSMFVDLFRVNPAAAGVSLGVFVAALAEFYLLRLAAWVPSLLFGSAIVVFAVALIVPPHHPSIEGLAVMVAVILATGVAFASEYKSDREFEILNAHKESLRAKVLREGQFLTVPLEEVVVGDTVILEMGDEIPADGRLLKANELYIDQSLMTGESKEVRKTPRPDSTADGPEQPDCLYRGTQVVDGVGEMVVTEVGDATALGQIARRLSAEEDVGEEGSGAEAGEPAPTEEARVKRKLTISKELTPLQLKLTHLAELISRVGYAAAGLIFLALFVHGFFVGELDPATLRTVAGHAEPQGWLGVAGNVLNYFVYMVIIIVVAVPEGLPMSVTVSLALAMQKMTRANSLVRQLVACETIGSATVICSDKTGTLTQNKMQVARLCWDGQTFDRGTPDWPAPETHLPWPRDGKPLDWLALNAAVNSTANLEMKEGRLVTVGNSTEGALLQWLRESDLPHEKLRLQFEPLYQIHFSSERKRMTTVIRYGERLVVLAKGAPEWLLEHATHYQAADGTGRDWTAEARQQVEDQLRDSAAQAMRTLAFGYAVLPPGTPAEEDALHALAHPPLDPADDADPVLVNEGRLPPPVNILEQNLVFAGFVAIRDPLREDVKDAVAQCRRAGIEVKMITGDNVQTARAIAYEIGLVHSRDAAINTPDAAILTSDELNRLSDEELKARLPALRVLARARPLDKFRIVKLLQELNEVVAVTGDGTNDAPALKKADVGLAMGIAGTEVSKEASKIVLLDDAFSTIVKAVHWGRSLYENIQRFIQFQLTINVSALAIAFLGPFFGVRPPFTILQLLWINVIMDTFAAIALCSEPPRPGLLSQPPKRKDENILTRPMVQTIFTTAAFFIVVMMTLLLGMENGWWLTDPQGERSRTFLELTYWQVAVFFSIYVFFQVWNQINCRSLVPQVSGFHGLFRNPVFLTIISLIVLGQLLIVTFGYDVFEVRPVGPLTWLVIAACTASVLIYAEIARRIRLAAAKAALSPAAQR
jgi:P-type Ca2+ transporter type 2C